MPPVTSQAEFAACLFDPSAAIPAGVTTKRGEPDPRRFDVYRNNFRVALVGALEQRFPVTRRLVGDDFFRGMARAFTDVSKPASPLMFEYGDDFPDFIVAFDPARPVPYLGDVAQLEMLWTRAYHAADTAPLGLAELAGIAPDLLPSARLVPHPAASVLHSQWPVGSMWEAHQRDPVAALAKSAPETILVVRPDTEVKVHVLPPQDGSFAAALFSGRTLETAAEIAAGDERFAFGEAIVGLVSLGAFQSLGPFAEECRP
jgi:hypothetical protein